MTPPCGRRAGRSSASPLGGRRGFPVGVGLVWSAGGWAPRAGAPGGGSSAGIWVARFVVWLPFFRAVWLCSVRPGQIGCCGRPDDAAFGGVCVRSSAPLCGGLGGAPVLRSRFVLVGGGGSGGRASSRSAQRPAVSVGGARRGLGAAPGVWMVRLVVRSLGFCSGDLLRSLALGPGRVWLARLSCCWVGRGCFGGSPTFRVGDLSAGASRPLVQATLLLGGRL
jgi:hypothetical protein